MSAETANLKDGDRRTVTIIFADLAGFSGLSEQLDPEEVDQLMNGLFSRFEAIVRQHEGSVEKYIGDALVAVFGYPLIHEDDAVRAVNAALDFQDAADSLSARQSAKLRFRIGIHTGLITTGRRGEFEVVTGHAMSVAARVQAEAPVGGILATRAVLDECGSDFLCSAPLSFTGKNLSDPIEACRVLGRNRQYLQAERLFVGRDQLVDAMILVYTKHQGHQPGGLLLTGEAGIGKTAIVRAFVAQVRRLPDFRCPILWARARRFRNRPFAVITDLIINHADIDARKPPEAIQEALAALPGISPVLASGFRGFLAGGDRLPADDSQAFNLLAGIIRAIAERSRTSVWSSVIFIDNTQLADRQSLDFLAWFIRNNPRQPFLVLTERESGQAGSQFAGLKPIEVPPLSTEESRILLRALLPDHPLDEATATQILDNAAGIPLFIQAYARFLRGNPDNPTGMPQTVQNLFLTTISRFNDDIRDFLKKLSVFRYSFTLNDALFIQARTDGDPGITEPALGFFEREDILWQEKGSWFFRHDIFKTALYDSLLNYNKRILHGLVAELMHSQESPHPVRLAYHLIRSEQYTDAIGIIESSPDALANLEFVPLIDAILDKTDPAKTDTRSGLVLAKARLLLNNGQNGRADTQLKELLMQAFTDADLRCAAGAYQLLAHYNRQSSRFQKAEFCGRKALACHERIPGSQREQAATLASLCLNSTAQGAEATALGWLARLEAVEGGDPGAGDLYRRTRIERALLLGRYREARGLLALLPEDQAPALHWRADWLQLRLRELVPRLEHWTQYRMTSGVEAVQALAILAAARRLLGLEAVEIMERAEFLGLQAQNDFDRVLACRQIGEAWCVLGDEAKAEETLLEGLALGERHSSFAPSFAMLALTAALHVRNGRWEKAAFHLDEARHILDLGVLVERRDRLLVLECQARLGTGDTEGGRASLLAEEMAEIDAPDARARLAALWPFGELAP
jgi:class 3 adenylate cyclase